MLMWLSEGWEKLLRIFSSSKYLGPKRDIFTKTGVRTASEMCSKIHWLYSRAFKNSLARHEARLARDPWRRSARYNESICIPVRNLKYLHLLNSLLYRLFLLPTSPMQCSWDPKLRMRNATKRHGVSHRKSVFIVVKNGSSKNHEIP